MGEYWAWFYGGLHATATSARVVGQRDRLERARSLMHRCYAEPLDLDAIARTAHMSRFHFAREFRREFDETPHQYLTQRRIEHAKQMLLYTDATVTEICLAVGFSSVGSFSTLFRRHTGHAPQHYRRHFVQSLGVPTVMPAVVPGCFLAHYAGL